MGGRLDRVVWEDFLEEVAFELSWYSDKNDGGREGGRRLPNKSNHLPPEHAAWSPSRRWLLVKEEEAQHLTPV